MSNRYRTPTCSVPAYTGWHGWLVYALCLILPALLCSGQALAGTLEARLDRAQITQGETVTLQLSTADDVQGDPDLGPLARDFEVLSRSQGSRLSIVNGHSTATRQWQIVLLPRHEGDLTVPALRIGTLESRPLPLRVQHAAATQAGAADAGAPVLVEIEADTETPYVQGEVAYTVRVLSRVPLNEASLSEPSAGDAIVEPAGEDSHYTTGRDGTTYQVTERHYAIFPQHSGPLTIEGPVLSAAVPVQNGKRRSLRERFFGGGPLADMDEFFGGAPFAGFPDFDNLFTETRPVRIRGEDVALDVQPRPAGVRGQWLPAKSLTLTEAWSPDPPVFRVGEPVTRTIALIADGLSAAQLPDLTPPAVAGLKTYPDQPQSETRAEDGTLITTRTVRTALIPTTAGTLTLPELRVPWWDTGKQQARVATLPERTIEILPGSAGATGTPAPAQPVAPTPLASATAGTVPSGEPATVQSPAARPSYWPWLAGAATAGWLITLVLWLRSRTGRVAHKPDPGRDNAPALRQQRAACRSRLRQACRADDPRTARAALLDWAALQWPDAPPRGLSGLAGHLDGSAAQQVIVDLNRILYDGNTQRHWDGRAAWPVLERLLGDKVAPRDDSMTAAALPDLYPQHVAGK
jgi:hypothetical protein